MPRGRPFKCPYGGCGSTTTVSKGARTTKSLGVRKIRLCKSCGRKFTPRSQRPAEAEAIQAEVTSKVKPENPLPPGSENTELTAMQMPEQ